MGLAASQNGCKAVDSITRLMFIAMCLALSLVVGCGSGGGTGVQPQPGNTAVTLLATSTANDRFTSFSIAINSLALTNQSGKTATLISKPLTPEFIHVNGTMEPLVIASIPPGTYTSATISVGGASLGCVGGDPSNGALVTGYNSYGQVPSNNVTVSLPTPITVSGAAMNLSLDLLASHSGSLASCTANAPYSITPTFAIAPISGVSAQSSSGSGVEMNFLGLISSAANGDGYFGVTTPNTGGTWTIQSTGATEYQGVAGVSSLVVGMAVNMNVEIQQDGSLLATKITVPDVNTSQITLSAGPLLQVNKFLQNGQDYVDSYALERQNEGDLLVNGSYFSLNSASFLISDNSADLQNLPFSASFTASDIVPGQNISITSHVRAIAPEPTYIPATTITLLPQTIDGTVNSVSSDNGFDIYTVTLAPYDLFPLMETVKGVTNLLTQPNTVVVYVGDDTQWLNTTPLTVGSVLRFNGLIFNDHGTLRMDCAWVQNGVKE